MAKPKEEVKQDAYFKDIHFLYEIFNRFKNTPEIKIFLKDILTTSELRMLKRRWNIANLLVKGLDIRTVANRSKTSTQTVSKVKKALEEGYGGLRLALERALEDEKKSTKKYIKSKSPYGGSKFVKGWFK